MNEGQLMGDFEAESKQLEAESWSRTVDSKFLKQQKKEVVKRQEVIYGTGLCSAHPAVPTQHSPGHSVGSRKSHSDTNRLRDAI